MKKLHLLIIRSYLGPFILTFFITLFIFVMQFLWKYIDELVGKGLEWHMVAQLLFYASANLVPMALPLSILLASIMTLGSLGEHYELVAMKSSGMSLMRILYPLLIVTIFTSMGAFIFTNYVWPKANLEFAALLYDIRHKKPAFDIMPGIYYDGIDGFVIRVGNKLEDGQSLEDILIYDHSKNNGNRNVIRAESGTMKMTDDQEYLLLTLFNGYSYEELDEQSRPLMMSSFETEIIRFDLSGFKIQRSDKEIFKDNYQMLNLAQLDRSIDTLDMQLNNRIEEFEKVLSKRTFPPTSDTAVLNNAIVANGPRKQLYESFKEEKKESILQTAMTQVRSNMTYIQGKRDAFSSNQRSINKHRIEWHRKFTLSIACIILFFIGAPMGAIIRKGGLGLPVVISVVFFLIFHITSITGEKLIKQGEMDAIPGMWMSTFVLFPMGVFLTYKAATDSRLMEFETYTKSLQKFFSKFKKTAVKTSTVEGQT